MPIHRWNGVGDRLLRPDQALPEAFETYARLERFDLLDGLGEAELA